MTASREMRQKASVRSMEATRVRNWFVVCTDLSEMRSGRATRLDCGRDFLLVVIGELLRVGKAICNVSGEKSNGFGG